MGTYRKPGVFSDPKMGAFTRGRANVDKAMDRLNAQQKAEQELFKEINESHQKSIAKNRKVQKAVQIDKLKASTEWRRAVKNGKPKKGGYNPQMLDMLQKWGDEYYDLYGKTDKASARRMDELLSFPDKLGQAQGIINANMQPWLDATAISGNGAGAVDYVNSWSSGTDLMYDITQNNGDGLSLREVPGVNGGASKLMWSVNGNDIDNDELVNYSVKGNLIFDVNGDIEELLKPYVLGVKNQGGWKEMLPGGNYDKGMTVTKQVGGMNVTEVEYNNEGLKEVGLNADMKSLLNNADDMRSIWPQLVDWAKNNNEELLYGPDKVPGGGDDLVTIDPNTGEPMPWFSGSDNDILKLQQAAAQNILVERMFDPAFAGQYGIKQSGIKTKKPISTGKGKGKTDPDPDNVTDKFDDSLANTNNIEFNSNGELVRYDAQAVVDLLTTTRKKGKRKYFSAQEVYDKGLSAGAFNSQKEADDWFKTMQGDEIFFAIDSQSILDKSYYDTREKMLQLLVDTYYEK